MAAVIAGCSEKKAPPVAQKKEEPNWQGGQMPPEFAKKLEEQQLRAASETLGQPHGAPSIEQ